MKSLALLAASALFLAACTAPPATRSANRVVEIGNNTGITMTHFYASNTSRHSWEEDIFGSEVLLSGRSVNIDINDGSGACVFDLKARFADGDEVVENGFNVCAQSAWVVR